MSSRGNDRYRNLFLLFLAMTLLVPGLAAERFRISGDWIRTTKAAGSDRTEIRGSAAFRGERFIITADSITVYGSGQRYVEATGNVLVRDQEKQIDISANRFLYDRTEDVMKLNGNCILEDFANALVLKGGMMEHRNKTETTIIQVGVRVLKEDLTARAELLVYHRDTDTAELEGMPVIIRNGQENRARRMVINLDTDEIEMTGRVSGSFEGDE